jgi:hypothetical protein
MSGTARLDAHLCGAHDRGEKKRRLAGPEGRSKTPAPSPRASLANALGSVNRLGWCVSRTSRSSRLLITEPPLLVLPSLASAIGLNEAIFLQQLHYWLLQAGKERDGRRWIYNTYDEWHTQLPFWSVRTIRRIVGTLEERGLVISTSAYNAHKVDKTKWYAIDYEEVDRLPEPADHVANLASPVRPIWPVDVDTLAASEPETTDRDYPQRPVEASKSPLPFEKYDQARLAILPYAEDLARELGDQAPLSSTTTRLTNMFRDSGLALDAFLDLLITARAITQERTPAIRTPRPEGLGPRPKMGYWFAVLEDLIAQALPATGTERP